MRYSARQQHCLQAMGVVPWVSRYAVAPDVAVAIEVPPAEEGGHVVEKPVTYEATTVHAVAEPSHASEMADVPVAPAALSTPEAPIAPAMTTSAEVETPAVHGGQSFDAEPPVSVASLGAWITSRALAPIRNRGELLPVLGAAEAALLVVVQQAEAGLATAALEGDAARLFDLMLRSIKLSGRDTRQCILSEAALAAPEMSVAGAGYTAHTRAIVVLMESWPFDARDIAAEQHGSRLPGPGPRLPVWRMAHPRLLLEQPGLKRQSWQILKMLSAQLNPEVSL